MSDISTEPIDCGAVAINLVGADEPVVHFDVTEMTPLERHSDVVKVVRGNETVAYLNFDNVAQISVLAEEDAEELKQMYR